MYNVNTCIFTLKRTEKSVLLSDVLTNHACTCPCMHIWRAILIAYLFLVLCRTFWSVWMEVRLSLEMEALSSLLRRGAMSRLDPGLRRPPPRTRRLVSACSISSLLTQYQLAAVLQSHQVLPAFLQLKPWQQVASLFSTTYRVR